MIYKLYIHNTSFVGYVNSIFENHQCGLFKVSLSTSARGGVSGRQLVTALVQSHEYYPFAFVDDDVTTHGSVIQGVHVHSPSIIRKLIKKKHATKVLFAIPSASRARRKEILMSLEPLVGLLLSLTQKLLASL